MFLLSFCNYLCVALPPWWILVDSCYVENRFRQGCGSAIGLIQSTEGLDTKHYLSLLAFVIGETWKELTLNVHVPYSGTGTLYHRAVVRLYIYIHSVPLTCVHLTLPRVPKIKIHGKSQIKFCKILKDK